jgi:hypothetical protein
LNFTSHFVNSKRNSEISPTSFESEAAQMMLAADLLTASDREHFQHVLSSYVRDAAPSASENAIEQARTLLMEVASGVFISNRSSAPNTTGYSPARLSSEAGSLLGLELEGLSAEDQEYEVAKQFVRLAAAAVAPLTAFPHASARSAREAFRNAVRSQAPGVVARWALSQ